MPKKIYAVNPEEREKECDHPLGFSYIGKIPNTNRQICFLCGSEKKEIDNSNAPMP
jgi:hypothetical protein